METQCYYYHHHRFLLFILLLFREVNLLVYNCGCLGRKKLLQFMVEETVFESWFGHTYISYSGVAVSGRSGAVRAWNSINTRTHGRTWVWPRSEPGSTDLESTTLISCWAILLFQSPTNYRDTVHKGNFYFCNHKYYLVLPCYHRFTYPVSHLWKPDTIKGFAPIPYAFNLHI